MRLSKVISAILHPIVMPTIGLLIYFFLTPIQIPKDKQLLILGIIFTSTYIIPLVLLFFLKYTNQIQSFEVSSIEERKFPMLMMICLFFFLGKFFYESVNLRDISYIFFGSALGIVIIYIMFLWRIKASLHLLSMGSIIGFFLVFQQTYDLKILGLISLLVFLSGLLASSRLYLKAHTSLEVYLGFFLGILCQFLMPWILQ